MKKILSITFFTILVFTSLNAQVEKYPVFKECQDQDIETLKKCFHTQVYEKVIQKITVPEAMVQDDFKGIVNAVFLVSKNGDFKVLYVNTPYKSFKKEVSSAFSALKKIQPATFNNHAVDMRFVMPIPIPLEMEMPSEALVETIPIKNTKEIEDFDPNLSLSRDAIANHFPEHQSQLNVPLVHQKYAYLDGFYNQRANSHTAVKPYIYSDVEDYVDLTSEKKALLKETTTWLVKKWWNDHMMHVQGKDYWFTLNPMVDLQVGKSGSINTYNNTRAIAINGGLGEKFNFSASIYESQGRFADYFNSYAESIKPSGGNPAVIPGRGIAKVFKTDSYDYPVAEAYLSYSPNKRFNFQFGQGKNFIGDGYRSLFLSDVASPYPHFKISTNFWKIKYTNLWMWLRDLRPEVTVDGVYKQKFMAMHYLSYNVTKKLNIGLFESVIWDDSNNRGFDINYLNPIIFYRAIEFSTGSKGGNALVGLSAKYKWNTKVSLYSQFLLDELTVSQITKKNGYWANKFGVQLGVKYYDAFHIKNLFLQAEYNVVRPYTYSHNKVDLNYGHANQSMAHLWGSNFKEFLAIARYTKERWYGNAKFTFGKKGFDYDTSTSSYGGDIYNDYSNRIQDFGNTIGQGNTANIFVADLQVGYLVNPTTNLKFFGGITYRNFNIDTPTITFNSANTTWFTVGLKTDVFNWYTDF